MSRIDELIKELCPEGVPWRAIGSFATCIVGATPSSGVSDYWDGGDIPWMSSGEVNRKTITYTEKSITQKGFDSSSTKLVPPNSVVIALAGQGKTRGLVAITRIALCTNQSLCAMTCDSTVLPDFLFYFLSSRYLELRGLSAGEGGRGGLNLQIIRNYSLPIPPLEIQKEIVSILDKFTQLEAELEAELEARRIQYEVTRDRLLDFSGDLDGHPLGARIRSLCPSGIQVHPLGDLVINRDSERKPVTRGLRQAGNYPYYGANGIQDYVDSYLFEGTFLLIGEDGSVMRMDGTPVLNWASGQIWVNNHAHVLQESAKGPSLRFLYFFLSTVDVSNFVTGGTQKKINQGNLNKIPVPVPPLEIQAEIVSILDKLDALVNDITIGLPAEIAARRKQYEYYRNKLLTFKELEAA